MDDAVPGSFYRQELTPCEAPSPNKTFIIAKQGPIKIINKRKMVFCDFLHYPKKFSQYLPLENVISDPEHISG
jgi:hypothetical protein